MASAPDHVIRLRGPWQYQLVDSKQHTWGEGSVRLPEGWTAWLASTRTTRGVDGWVILRRPFGHPTGIEPNDRIHLRIENVPSSFEIRLNGRSLAAAGEARIEISGLLARTNLLELRGLLSEANSETAPAVQLEITHARASSDAEASGNFS